MLTNESDSRLIGILQDVEPFLGQLPAAELRTFDQGWQALAAYVGQSGSTEAEMLHELEHLLAASPTLSGQGLAEVVKSVSRYTPQNYTPPAVPRPGAGRGGPAPVRNEVVTAIYQLSIIIREQVAQLPL